MSSQDRTTREADIAYRTRKLAAYERSLDLKERELAFQERVFEFRVQEAADEQKAREEAEESLSKLRDVMSGIHADHEGESSLSAALRGKAGRA